MYNDLVKELIKKDNQVYIVAPIEKKYKKRTEMESTYNLSVLRVKIGNITKCGMIEKGITTMMIESQYLKAIKKHFKDIKFDLVLYSTPPITFAKIVDYFKKTQGSTTYLMLKDIFPQNAVDIGLMKKDGFIHKYFRKKEKKLYGISDYIGCMSEANVRYLLEHNPEIRKEKVEVFPNSINPIEKRENKQKDISILKKYKIPEKAVLFVYGGNLGKPQGIDFLLEVADNFHKVENGFFLIVGSGTEYRRIQNHFEENNPKNCALYSFLPKNEYDQLINNADVGLIFLDKRFTIPNFPSRIPDYMENSMPILAATDKATDVKDVLLESQSGMWSESGDIDAFITNANKIAGDEKLRKEMSTNSRKYLEENYDVRNCVNKLIRKL